MNVEQAMRKVCLSLPESEEVLSHGIPNFRVRGKSFAIYARNHHGDGRLALWLEAPPGAQSHFTEIDPVAYFIPPYVGPNGWLGVELNKGVPWAAIVDRVREAYMIVAPAQLRKQAGPAITIKGAVKDLTP